MNDLEHKIYECECKPCCALRRLIDECGADFRISETKAGRLCELAVVAAEGVDGIFESDVVAARRSYAQHLGVKLTGSTSNAEDPTHIAWAVKNSNHNPTAKNRINLGSAKASNRDGRYFIQMPIIQSTNKALKSIGK
jgi:hypothetical protein